MALGAITLAAGCSSDTEDDAPSAEGSGDSGVADDAASTSGAASQTWARANLGFVSAYVLARGGQAVVVDTGTEGSAEEIEAVLTSLGLAWGDVGDVVLTHSHPDHIGSAAAIAGLAPEAMFHAGEADVAAIDIGRSISALVDGDMVFDLQMIHTPGHTPGHISVLDTANSVLVAGDALTGDGGRVGLPNPEFTPEYDEAVQSVKYLGTFDYDTVYFGHGEPVMGGASAEVAALEG